MCVRVVGQRQNTPELTYLAKLSVPAVEPVVMLSGRNVKDQSHRVEKCRYQLWHTRSARLPAWVCISDECDSSWLSATI